MSECWWLKECEFDHLNFVEKKVISQFLPGEIKELVSKRTIFNTNVGYECVHIYISICILLNIVFLKRFNSICYFFQVHVSWTSVIMEKKRVTKFLVHSFIYIYITEAFIAIHVVMFLYILIFQLPMFPLWHEFS